MAAGARGRGVPVTLGQRIRAIRASVGMSQATLATRCGLSQQMIDAVESGRRKDVRVTTARKLADGLGVRVSWLMGEDS